MIPGGLVLLVPVVGVTATAAATAAAATSSDPTTGLLNYGLAGILGFMLVALFYRWLTREQQRGDAAEAEVKRLNELLLSTATSAVETVRGNVRVVEENTKLLGEVRDVLDDSFPQPPRRPATPRRRS